MNKILLGMLLGAVLGLFDGATAWFTPEVRPQMLGIIIGSTLKGVMAGVAAGIFARKVQSTVAGVIFGLLVGLALAYWVAAMQGKYYFEIMLPGATVGAILGWATQRYGRPVARHNAAATIAMIALALVGTSVYAHDHAPAAQPTAAAAFEKLKSLAGTWNGHSMKVDGAKTTVTYEVTAGGNVVMERMFVGEPHEMINMYTLDGNDVIATHYCSGGTQPVLKLNAARSSANELVFDFVRVSPASAKSYINGVRMKFGADGKLQEEWSSAGDGVNVTLYLNGKL